MRKIHCLNAIAKVGTDRFDKDYTLTDKIEEADAIMVRSAAMGDMEFSENLLAIARAGAGVNNIPLERCDDKGIVVFYNLELRLTNLNDEEQLSDYHIIFSDELSPQNIKDVLANIIVKVGHTEKTANSITDKNDFQRAAVDFEELHKVLSSESLHINGKYLTGFLSRGHGNSICGRSRAYTVYEDIVRKSDIIIHSSDFIENLKRH